MRVVGTKNARKRDKKYGLPVGMEKAGTVHGRCYDGPIGDAWA